MNHGEQLVQIGMRAAIRDVQEYVNDGFEKWMHEGAAVVDVDRLNAYLLALLITAGGYDDGES